MEGGIYSASGKCSSLLMMFSSDSDHWCPVLHCWIGWWVSWWCSVVYCYGKWQSKHHPPPSQPAPLYEDIVTSTVKGEVELQLRDNVAYGQVK